MTVPFFEKSIIMEIILFLKCLSPDVEFLNENRSLGTLSPWPFIAKVTRWEGGRGSEEKFKWQNKYAVAILNAFQLTIINNVYYNSINSPLWLQGIKGFIVTEKKKKNFFSCHQTVVLQVKREICLAGNVGKRMQEFVSHQMRFGGERHFLSFQKASSNASFALCVRHPSEVTGAFLLPSIPSTMLENRSWYVDFCAILAEMGNAIKTYPLFSTTFPTKWLFHFKDMTPPRARTHKSCLEIPHSSGNNKNSAGSALGWLHVLSHCPQETSFKVA